MPPSGFEQFAVGQVFPSPGYQVSAAEVKAFAGQFDPQAQHLDEAAASGTMFGELVASGWQTASLTMRLMLEGGLAGVKSRGMGLEVKHLKWLLPVRPGDTLHAQTEVLELRPSRSKPDRGVVIARTVTLNQHDQPVLEMTSSLLVLRSIAPA